MENPWEQIALSDYENHMKLDTVMQLQTMNTMMKEQFYQYPVRTVMILGIAGGNGLEHIDVQRIETVYGVDVNAQYLKECADRYPKLQGILRSIRCDLTEKDVVLPRADLVVANLLIEYVGYKCFQNAIRAVCPQYVSCIIQINTDESFVSESPYLHVFDCLDSVHHQMDGNRLREAMKDIGYEDIMELEQHLPNGKKLVRIDFVHMRKPAATNIFK